MGTWQILSFGGSYYPIDGMKFLIYIYKTAIYFLFVLIPCKIPFLFLKPAELTKKIFSINSIYSGFSFGFLSIYINQIAFQKQLNVFLSLRFAKKSPNSSECTGGCNRSTTVTVQKQLSRGLLWYWHCWYLLVFIITKFDTGFYYYQGISQIKFNY